MKRHQKTMVMVLYLSLFIAWFGAGHVLGASTEETRVADLVEGAKKEGKLVFYTAMSVNEAVPLMKKFEAKYPFIKTELFRERGEKQVIRILAEERAGKTMADAIQLGGFQVHLVKKEGVLMKYVSPESKYFPPGFRDPDGFWTDTFVNINVMAYNTKLVPANQAPKTFDDLLDPKWKDKLIMDYQEYEWFNVILKKRGREKGLVFMKKLASQDLGFRNSRTLVANMVVAGEFPVAVSVYADRAEQFKRAGAPLEWVPADPVVAKLHPVAITAQAPHPNAAKLFVDYLLSKEGQSAFDSLGNHPSRPDVETHLPKLSAVTLVPSDPTDAEQYNSIVKEYKSIFRIK